MPLFSFELIGVLALFLVFGGWLVWLELRLRKLFRGRSAKTLEGLVYEHAEVIAELVARTKELEGARALLEKHTEGVVQKVSMLRFNPFSDTGGDQSFVIALLDGTDTGFVLSGLYMQGRPFLYAKPIERGASRYTLSKEEEAVLKEAIESKTFP